MKLWPGPTGSLLHSSFVNLLEGLPPPRRWREFGHSAGRRSRPGGPAFPWPPRSGIPSLRTRNAPSGAVVPPAPLVSFLSAGLLGIRPQSRPLSP
eukprot:scaffold2187_cov109-Isochrysis_galbana.AAC.11